MATTTGPVDRRAPHIISETPQPDQVPPTNNSSCISTIFSSCVAEDNCCCTSLKSLGDIIWSALSSCWSAIASIFASIFGGSQSSKDLQALQNLLNKWEPLASRINSNGATPLQEEEWKDEIAALPETLRNKIKQALIDDLEVAEEAMQVVAGNEVMHQINLLMIPQCLPKVTAFEDKWKVKALQLPISANVKAEWANDLQILLDTSDLSTFLYSTYSHENVAKLPAHNDIKHREACIALMKDEMNYPLIALSLGRWKEYYETS